MTSLAFQGHGGRPEAPTWLRFGLPPAGGWSRLEAALQSAKEHAR